MRLLVTRPDPDATRTAEVLRGQGHEVLVAPVLVTQAVEAEIRGPHAAVLMTSVNAARAASRFGDLHPLLAFAVGDRTAEAARASGFVNVESAAGALPDLVEVIAKRFAGQSVTLLYLTGEDRSGDLAGELAAHGIAVDTAIVYRAVAVEELAAELVKALSAAELDGALHYSPRSVATLLRLAAGADALNALLNLAHYCLSEAVAAPLREAGARRIAVAPQPDETALLGLI